MFVGGLGDSFSIQCYFVSYYKQFLSPLGKTGERREKKESEVMLKENQNLVCEICPVVVNSYFS